MMDRKVNLFLIGAMKAGTTSVVDLLSQHPAIYVPPVKEPHFFVEDLPKALYEPSKFFNLETYLENEFPKPLHIANIEQASQYQKLYSLNSGEPYLLDASTAYMHAPRALNNIRDYNPNAKILVILRDPLQRAFSHYKMDFGKGRVTHTFEEELKKQLTASEDGKLKWYSHLGMSRYKQPLAVCHELFDSVRVISIEELKAAPTKVATEIFQFLDIPSVEIDLKSSNKSRKFKFQKILNWSQRIGLKDYLSKFIGTKTRSRFFRWFSSSNAFEMDLTPETTERVNRFFQQESKL